MSNLSIWYKRKNESKYHDVTEYIMRNTSFLSWDRNINNKLFDFDIVLYQPLDSDSLPIICDTGDVVAITENYNDLPNKIFGNSFVGIVEVIDEEYNFGVNESETDFNTPYTLKVRNKTFSQNNVILNTTSSANLSDLVETILSNCTDLGGSRSNGISIPKYYLGTSDVSIAPINLSGGELEVLNNLLTNIGYYFRFNYILETNTENNIHIIKQIEIYDISNPSMSLTNDWVFGLTYESLRDGIIDNLDFGYSDASQYIYTESKIKYKKDATVVKNYFKLQVAIKDLTDSALVRYTEIGSDKNIYNIGYAFDIKYVAIQVLDTIFNVSGTTIFDVNTTQASTINYYQTRLNNNSLGGKMTCKITISSVDYFRDFTISGSTITLSTSLTGLSNGNAFELVNCFDILKENEVSYPGDGDGYVIKSVNKDSSTLKFTDYDSPTPSQKLICYYNPISVTYIPNQYEGNISALGLRILDEKIDFPISAEQKDQIVNTYLKFVEPLETLSFSSFRKNMLEIGAGLNVNFGRLNKTMIVTSSKGEVIADEGFYSNKPLIMQQIELSSYRDTLNDLLAKLLNISKVDETNSLATNTKIIINESFTISEVVGSIVELTTPTILPADNITSSSFQAHWITTNAVQYHVQVSTDSNFSSIVYSNLVYYSAGIGSTATIIINIDTSVNLYFRVRAYSIPNYSNWSNTEFISSGIVNDFILPSGKTFQFNLDSVAMIGSGTNITSSDSNHLACTTNCIWVSDTQFVKGLSGSTLGTYLNVANSSAYRDQGASARIVHLGIIELHDITSHKVISSIYNGYGSSHNVQNHIFLISGNKLRLYLYCPNYTYDFDVEANMTGNEFVANTKYAVAAIIDLANDTLKFIVNQTTYTYTNLTVTMANFKANGGINSNINTSPTNLCLMRENANYSSPASNINLWRYGIQANTNLLTETEIKTIFASMGFT